MKIININGPINSGKTTVSKILVDILEKAVFIEVDDLLSDEEQKKLNLDFRSGINERLRRLDNQVKIYMATQEYNYIIFAYPMSEKNYNRWVRVAENQDFVAVTLSPSLENCLTNRGQRELNDFEIKRIKEMYDLGYNNPKNTNFIINNDNQKAEETAFIIAELLK